MRGVGGCGVRGVGWARGKNVSPSWVFALIPTTAKRFTDYPRRRNVFTPQKRFVGLGVRPTTVHEKRFTVLGMEKYPGRRNVFDTHDVETFSKSVNVSTSWVLPNY